MVKSETQKLDIEATNTVCPSAVFDDASAPDSTVCTAESSKELLEGVVLRTAGMDMQCISSS